MKQISTAPEDHPRRQFSASAIAQRWHRFLFPFIAFALNLSISLSAESKPHRVVLIAAEYEYRSLETLPPFTRFLEMNYPLQCAVLARPTDPKKHEIKGLKALQRADLAIFFIRRMTLPEDQLAAIKAYASSGKPIIALRTSSHAFENWKEFDRLVLGGNYEGHHDKKLATTVTVAREAEDHPILKGVTGFVSKGSLYRNTPLPPDSRPLLFGAVPNQPIEPVAWTHSYQGARVFYTSLGHPNDFDEPSFRQLLVNAVFWALGESVPAARSEGADGK